MMANVTIRLGIITVLCAVFLVAGCGRKGPLEPPSERISSLAVQG